jgi:hypothetical protein
LQSKNRVNDQTLNFFVSTETVGQPNLREVAHEQTLIAITIRANPASNLFFIVKRIFSLTAKRLNYFTNIGLFFKNEKSKNRTNSYLYRPEKPELKIRCFN